MGPQGQVLTQLVSSRDGGARRQRLGDQDRLSARSDFPSAEPARPATSGKRTAVTGVNREGPRKTS